jgi:hypothetical protein
MYYVTTEKQKNTPKPFLELRIFAYFERKLSEAEIDKIIKLMYSKLEYLEWIMMNLVTAVLNGTVYQETDGFENEQIDEDEAKKEFESLGLREGKFFEEIYRQVLFYKRDGRFIYKGEDYILALQIEREASWKLNKVSDENLMDNIKQKKAWWNHISFDQYLRLKKRLGV